MQQKVNKLQDKLQRMQKEFEAKNDDPKEKAINEEAVRLAAIEYFGKEKGESYIKDLDLAEEKLGVESGKNYAGQVVNPLYFGEIEPGNLISGLRVLNKYAYFFGLMAKHKRQLKKQGFKLEKT